jgi:hypothetical protein
MNIDNAISTGDGVSVLICCDYTPQHHWMSFAAWYSVYQNMPDAEVGILCNRTEMGRKCFHWTPRCNVKFDLHKPLPSWMDQIKYALSSGFLKPPIIALKPHVMAVKPFSDEWREYFSINIHASDLVIVNTDSFITDFVPLDICLKAKDETPATFVTYQEGWGKFVAAKWIDKAACPFLKTSFFKKGELTINEKKIGELWERMGRIYQAVSRG